MTDAIGRSVRLFLVDGKSTGLITAEIMNWTGHVLTGPRAELPKFLARPEVARTGVYLLHGRDLDDPDRTMLYIGESDLVGTRLKKHNQEDKRDYWERTCVIISKDQNITKAHARYLESRLIGIAAKVKRATLDNGTAPPEPDSEWLILNEDVAFSSPSAAGAVVLGRSFAGCAEWKVKGTQQTYASWQEEQIAQAEQDPTAPAELGA
ncbi:MAG: GIY-YIG nuclease family protein [Chromatiaceae bacterium]|nr:GIY-YIG nuclease family protein [Chromatiaceae bacterium]